MALLFVHRAWAALEAGDDPEKPVAAGLAAAPAGHEYRGALLACRARRQSLSGPAPAADEAIRALGEPRTWIGRRGLVDALMAGGKWGRAIEVCGPMLQPERPWSVPLSARGTARVRMGLFDDAWEDLGGLVSTPAQAPTAALLAAASARLRTVEERRRARGEFADALRKARACVDEVVQRHPEHPEALNLSAVADLIDAQERGSDAPAAVAKLDRALARVPGYVDALVHRAAARMLAGTLAKAIEDLDQALRESPERHSARLARGIARFQAGRPREALDDWKRAVAGDAKLDTPDVRGWIRRAEAMIR